MADILVLRARLRKRDKDIQQAVSNLKLEEGEMADMLRDGFRMKLVEMGVLGRKSTSSITPDTARLMAMELINFKSERSGQYDK